jgi:glutamate carboxypeptidase
MQHSDFDLATYLEDLQYLVNIDSGSYDTEGVAQVAEFFSQRFSALGWKVKLHQFDSSVGPCVEIVNGDQNQYDVLLMGHMDTVFKKGTTQERPFMIKDGKALGPGVNDMKAGLLQIYYTLRALHAENALVDASICIALNCDEEISSKYSRNWLETLAKKSRYVLVLEAARQDGNLVNKRKGVGRYTIDFTGIEAHSGVDHQSGKSAIEELAHWILALHEKTNYATGTTVNVGKVSGGSAVNVVAGQAKAEVDVRFYDLKEAEMIDQLIHSLAANPKVSGIKAVVSGGVTRPPMIPSEKTLMLCNAVEIIGSQVGIKVGWTATGGGSDGSFAAIMGVPTLDGLGPIGGGSHGPQEYLLIDSIEPRFCLLCEIVKYIVNQKSVIN